ncbi:MAG: hypothetical protein IJR83_01145 [Clostridia bacterium]|nr:hypothetical protein [Clostridia bacterium]
MLNIFFLGSSRLWNGEKPSAGVFSRAIAQKASGTGTEVGLYYASDLLPRGDIRPDIVLFQADEVPAGEEGQAYAKRIAASLDGIKKQNRAARIFVGGPGKDCKEAYRALMAAAVMTGAEFVALPDAKGDISDAYSEKAAELFIARMDEKELLRDVMPDDVPDGETIEQLFGNEDLSHVISAIRVNGKNVRCFGCRLSAIPFNRVWPGYQRKRDQTEIGSFASFRMGACADVEIDLPKGSDTKDIVIRPLSCGIVPAVEKGKLRFTLPRPGCYSVEIGGRHNNLTIFADSYKKEIPGKPTYEFGPGVHHAGRIHLHSGESLCIRRGAVVHAEVEATDADGMRIYGGGILDGSEFKRSAYDGCDMQSEGLVHFTRCRNVLFEDVVLLDSAMWTMTAINCKGLEFSHVKVIGMWRYNSDGFDFVNSQNVHVHDCFLRTFDDVIVLKGLALRDSDGGRRVERMNMANYLVENCVLWCDWGGSMEFGAETVADKYDNIIWRNCDIIRLDDAAMRIHSGDRAQITNVLYSDIRIEYSKHDTIGIYQQSEEMKYEPEPAPNHKQPVRAWMYCGMWSPDGIPGQIRHVRYENIAIYADKEVPEPEIMFYGADSEHRISDAVMSGITYNGKPWRPHVSTNGFADDIRFED